MNYIYVLTQEKAIAVFANESAAFSKRMILVADEIQNIERIKEDKDERSKILFDTLMEFRYKENVEQIIIAGPRIEEIDNLGESIFGLETEDISTEISPVLNLTYSICQIGKQYFLKQYSVLNDSPICKEIQNAEMINGYGKLIELGVPRETALYIYNRVLKERKIDAYDELKLEKSVREILFEQYHNMPQWIQCQLDFLI